MNLFVWDRDYNNKEQVRPYLDTYTALRGQGVFYNDDFLGKIPGVAGSPDEKTAIYLLSNLWHIEQERTQIAAALADGYVRLEQGDPGSVTRYARVIVYRPGHYVGGTGLINTYENARVILAPNGKPSVLIPKGKRNGYQVNGAELLVRQ
jgi:hypothetical protein